MFIHITMVGSKFSSGTLLTVHLIYLSTDIYQGFKIFAHSCISIYIIYIIIIILCLRETVIVANKPFGASSSGDSTNTLDGFIALDRNFKSCRENTILYD